MHVWDMRTGESIHQLEYGDQDIHSVFLDGNDFWVCHGEGDILFWKMDALHKEPERFTESEIQSLHPVAWEALLKGLSVLNDEFAVVRSVKGGLQWTLNDGTMVRWFADGEWRPEQSLEEGLVVATCWNDLAFLKLQGLQR